MIPRRNPGFNNVPRLKYQRSRRMGRENTEAEKVAAIAATRNTPSNVGNRWETNTTTTT